MHMHIHTCINMYQISYSMYIKRYMHTHIHTYTTTLRVIRRLGGWRGPAMGSSGDCSSDDDDDDSEDDFSDLSPRWQQYCNCAPDALCKSDALAYTLAKPGAPMSARALLTASTSARRTGNLVTTCARAVARSGRRRQARAGKAWPHRVSDRALLLSGLPRLAVRTHIVNAPI